MKSEELSRALKDEKPVVMMSGDRYIVQRALEYIKRRVIPGVEMRDVNLTTFEGKEAAAPAVTHLCKTAPVFAPRRLVIAVDPADVAAYADYCAAPTKSTCLVIIVDKPDARTKTVAAIKRAGALVHFDTPKEHELPRWLAAEEQTKKIPVTSDACALIVLTVGSDLAQLADALERTYLSAPRGAQVGIEHVERALCLTRKDSIFDLTDACAARNKERAVQVLENLIKNRDDPFRILKMLESTVRKLLQAVEMCADGHQTGDSMAAALKMHPYVAGKLLQAARTLTMDRAWEMHSALHDAAFACSIGSKAMGFGKLGDRVYVEQLVLRMCG